MISEIIKNIKKGWFLEGYAGIKYFSEGEQEAIIYDFGNSFDISSYAFTNYLILKNLNFFVAQKLSYGLCYSMFNYLPGAMATAYSHVLSMIEKNPQDFDLLELQAYLYEIPGEVFSSSEMHRICKQILALKPDSEMALDRFFWTKKTAVLPVVEVGEGLEGIEKTKVLIEKGRFSKAFFNISTHEWSELIEALRQFAVDGNLFAYAFVWELIRKNETAELHLFAAEFFLKQYVPFLLENNFSGKEAITFFHTYRAAELESNTIEIQEKLLNLYEPGNASFDVEEAKKRAQKVLELKPESEPALRVLRLLEACN